MWFCLHHTDEQLHQWAKDLNQGPEVVDKAATVAAEYRSGSHPEERSCWAHPETVFSMVADKNPDMRARAIHAIQKSRMRSTYAVRPYTISHVIF